MTDGNHLAYDSQIVFRSDGNLMKAAIFWQQSDFSAAVVQPFDRRFIIQ